MKIPAMPIRPIHHGCNGQAGGVGQVSSHSGKTKSKGPVPSKMSCVMPGLSDEPGVIIGLLPYGRRQRKARHCIKQGLTLWKTLRPLCRSSCRSLPWPFCRGQSDHTPRMQRDPGFSHTPPKEATRTRIPPALQNSPFTIDRPFADQLPNPDRSIPSSCKKQRGGAGAQSGNPHRISANFTPIQTGR